MTRRVPTPDAHHPRYAAPCGIVARGHAAPSRREVVAGAERAALGLQPDHAHLVAGAQLLQRRFEVVAQPFADRVQLLGAIEDDRRDPRSGPSQRGCCRNRSPVLLPSGVGAHNTPRNQLGCELLPRTGGRDNRGARRRSLPATRDHRRTLGQQSQATATTRAASSRLARLQRRNTTSIRLARDDRLLGWLHRPRVVWAPRWS